MIEYWRDVTGFEGLYEVSDLGAVRSVPRKRTRGRVLKQSIKNGYLKTTLHKKGKQYGPYVHRLVLEAFAGLALKGTEACHEDGDRTNNILSNLRWDSRKNNHADKKRHGTNQEGEDHHRSKFTNEDIFCIRQLWIKGNLNQNQIAVRFDTVQPVISKIVTRKLWGHI